MPIIDKTGTDWSPKTGIPPVAFLTSVLLNFYLEDLDRAFEARLPQVPYARYDYEVFIPGKNYGIISSKLSGTRELGLSVKVTGLVRGKKRRIVGKGGHPESKSCNRVTKHITYRITIKACMAELSGGAKRCAAAY